MSTPGSRKSNQLASKAANAFDESLKSRWFNSAWMGLESVTARKAAEKAAGDWGEVVEEAKRQVAILLQQPREYITVFHNTTAGVQRIFLRLRHLIESSNPTLLITDLEYPGIVSLVDENWEGRLVMAEVANLIWEGNAHLVDEALRRSIVIARPSVVYLSHIARTNGYRINESLIEFIRDINPRAVIIIDGAQACGNIDVEKTFLENIDFYVTSGHKWLCARPTLGLVYAHERWKLPDPAQSYSMRYGSGGTGNLDTLFSLIAAVKDFNGELTGQEARNRMQEIEEHNSRLARSFSEAMKQYDWHSVGAENEGAVSKSSITGSWRWNGIVTFLSPGDRIVQALQQEDNAESNSEPRNRQAFIESEYWRDSSGGDAPGKRYLLWCATSEQKIRLREENLRITTNPVSPSGCLRFCFHYYHSEEDVQSLIARIQRAMNREAAN